MSCLFKVSLSKEISASKLFRRIQTKKLVLICHIGLRLSNSFLFVIMCRSLFIKMKDTNEHIVF